MRILATILVFIFTLSFVVIGGFLFAYSLNLFTTQDLLVFLNQTFNFENINVIVGGVGVFLIVASILIAQIIFGKIQREKTIAFDNPDGQVTVSLSAIEDFIKRLSSSITGIKELRSDVIAGKKGIEITTRVSLWADVNIPQTTEDIQRVIKSRIQEILGVEEPIIIRVHVGKIVEKEKRPSKKKEEHEAEEAAPFRGSIEY